MERKYESYSKGEISKEQYDNWRYNYNLEGWLISKKSQPKVLRNRFERATFNKDDGLGYGGEMSPTSG